VNPYDYYRIVHGCAGETRPPASPSGLKVAPAAEGRIALTWEAPADSGPGGDCYKIYRDEKPVGLSTGPSWTESFPGITPATSY